MVPIPVSDRAPEARTTRETDRFLRDLVYGMRCGVLSIDRHGTVTLVNEPALQILELDEAPAPGTPVEQALHDHPQLARILRESFRMSSLPNRAEMDLRFKGRKGKTLGFTLSLVGAPHGQPYGAAAFFKDLTQVEQKEEQERLKDRLAALGQMAASMAHEIRNPLASIEVSCSLLKRRLGGGGAEAELLDKIIAEVRRLNGTISSSLEFVRPISLDLAPADLAPVLAEALQVALSRRGSDRVEVVERIAPRLPPVVMDRVRIRQVFENLMVNALEAMEGQGRLTVEASLSPAAADAAGVDPWVQIRVADTGPGIDEEHYDKLFHPFFTTKKSGSGVGLSTAEKVVTSHRGLIGVENRPGRGAVFTVRMPVSQAESEDRI